MAYIRRKQKVYGMFDLEQTKIMHSRTGNEETREVLDGRLAPVDTS